MGWKRAVWILSLFNSSPSKNRTMFWLRKTKLSRAQSSTVRSTSPTKSPQHPKSNCSKSSAGSSVLQLSRRSGRNPWSSRSEAKRTLTTKGWDRGPKGRSRESPLQQRRSRACNRASTCTRQPSGRKALTRRQPTNTTAIGVTQFHEKLAKLDLIFLIIN